MEYPVALSAEQVSFFYENGYLIVRHVIPKQTLEKLREGAQRLVAKYAEYRDESNVFFSTMEATSFEAMLNGSAAREGLSARRLWRVDKLDQKLPEVAELKRLPFVHHAMEALLGPEIFQYNESFVIKLARVGPPVLWHQDPSFKIKKQPEPIVTCDVYLDESDQDNGCLWVVPGSHKRGVIDTGELMEVHGFDLPGAVPVLMKPGDVAFHDNGTLHGSKANNSDRQRRIIYLAFQTLRQARSAGAFTEEFIRERLDAFDRSRREGMKLGALK